MTAPKVFKSTDVNAAVLTGQEAKLSGLIRYIAPLLGWEIIHDDGPRIAIRQGASIGNKHILFVDDRATRGGSAPYTAKVCWYESMAGIDAGAGEWGASIISKATNSFHSNTSKTWEIIGDEYGFHIVIYTDSDDINNPTGYCFYGYFGDGLPLYDQDACFKISAGAKEDIPTDMGNYLMMALACNNAFNGGCAYPIKAHRSKDGMLSNISIGAYANGGLCQVGAAFAAQGVNYPAKDSKAFFSMPLINDGNPFSIRGHIPGLFYPSHTDFVSGTSVVDGTNVLRMHCALRPDSSWGSGTGCWLAINTGEGFRL